MAESNEEWWRQHGSAVKARLTKAERIMGSQPGFAQGEALRVFELMEEHGYPDWWSRVQRLHDDAALRADWRWG